MRSFAVMPQNYRWVVLVAAFLSTVANSAIFFAFGTFVLPWMNEFAASAAAVAAVTSFGSSLSSIACPIGSYVIQRLGYRATHVIGGVMLFASFASSSFAESLGLLFFTYSIIGGLGSSLCMISFVNAVSEHFQDNQALAFGVVLSAYGVGGFIFPLYFETLIAIYTWRGAMLITAAVFGNVIVCGLLFHTPTSHSCFEGHGYKNRKSSSSAVDVTGSNIEGSQCSDCNDEVGRKDRVNKSVWDETFIESDRSEAFCVKLFSCCERSTQTVVKNLDENMNKRSLDEKRPDVADSEKSDFFRIFKTLLRTWSFYVLLVHNIATYMGFFLVFGLTPIRASYDLNLSDQQAFILVSSSGIANCIARVGFAALVHFKWVRASTMYLCSFAVGGILALTSLQAKSYLLQIIYSLSNSACFANVTFYNLTVFQIYGRRLFNVSYGFLEMMHGIGIATGPIIGGAIFDHSGSCELSFVFAGLAIFLGTLVLPIGLAVSGDLRKLDF